MLLQSFKEMTFYKVRYLLILCILFLVSTLVFIINGLANGLAMDNASSIKNMLAHSFYVQEEANNRLDRSRIPLNGINDEIFTNSLQPLSILMTSFEVTKSKKTVDVTIFATNINSFLGPSITEGEKLKNGENVVVLNDSMKESGINTGDYLKDTKTGLELKVVGFTKNQTFSHTPVAHISIETWKELAGNVGVPYYSAIVQKNKGEVKINQIANTKLMAKNEIVNNIPGYQAEQNSLYMMLGFLIVIAAFVLTAFFYIMTIQKSYQFGILKAIGTKTTILIQSSFVQVMVLTTTSLSLALVFTWIIRWILPMNIPFIFDLPQLLLFSAIIYFVSVLGALLSAFNINKIDPILAMGRGE